MTEKLPEIRESEAPPEAAAIYAEIRAATGLPLVNLIWRHFAALPGALPWAWGAVRPAAQAGLVVAAAERVTDALAPAPAPPIERDQLAAVGVHDKAAYGGLAAICRVLDAYNRGNACNLVALTALLQGLEAGFPAEPAAAARPAAAPTPIEALPPLPRLDELDEQVRRSVAGLASRHAGFEAGAVPSLYLHLAHWPGLLDLARGRIEQLPLAELRERTRELAKDEASVLLSAMAAPAPPAAVRDAVELALGRFARGLIAEMLPVGLALRRALPSP
jgi:hypothetical protein